MFEKQRRFFFMVSAFSYFFLYVLLYFSESQNKLGVTSQDNFFRRILGSQTPNTSIIYTTPYLAGIFLYLHSRGAFNRFMLGHQMLTGFFILQQNLRVTLHLCLLIKEFFGAKNQQQVSSI